MPAPSCAALCAEPGSGVQKACAGGELDLGPEPNVLAFEVEVGQRYLWVCRCTGVDTRSSAKGALLMVTYLTASGAAIAGPYEGCFTSRRSGQTAYLPVHSEAETNQWQVTPLLAPPRAVKVLLGLRTWAARGAVRLERGWELYSRSSRLPLHQTRSYTFEFRVDPAWSYLLQGSCHSSSEANAQGASVGITYFDEAGVLSDTVAEVTACFELKLEPPQCASAVALRFSARSNTLCELSAALDLREYQLRVEAVSEAEFLKRARALAMRAPQSVEPAILELLARDPHHLAALSVLEKLQQARGELRAAERTLALMHSLSENQATFARLRRVRGALVELGPEWLPVVPGRSERHCPRDRSSILHLVAHKPMSATDISSRFRHQLLRAQRREGMRASAVVAIEHARGLQRRNGPGIEAIDGVPYFQPDPFSFTGFDALSVDQQLVLDTLATASVLRAERPAVLHAVAGNRGYELALKGLALSRHFGLPLLYEVEALSDVSIGAQADLSEHAQARAAQQLRCLNAAHLVVVPNESLKDALVARGLARTKVCCIARGVDTEHFSPGQPDHMLAARLGVDGRFVIGCDVGALGLDGSECVLQALRVLLDRGHRVTGLFYNDTPSHEPLRAVSCASGVTQHARFVGPVPHLQLPRHYSIMDAIVCSAQEGADCRVSQSVLEAMAMGCTILARDVPTAHPLIEPGVRGLLFDAASSTHLATQAEIVIGNEYTRQRFGAAARQRAVSEHSLSVAAKRYRSLYAQLSSAPRASDSSSPRRLGFDVAARS